MPHPDAADRLALFLAPMRGDAVPAPVRDHAGLVLADTVGAVLAGLEEPQFRAFAPRLAAAGGPVRLPGGTLRATAPEAAMLLGFAGTAAELDEGNYAAGGHPAIHAVAAVLAEADRAGVTGAALLDAAIVGYEAGARVGMATRLRPAAHPHGTWGTVGAAAAVARLRGWDAGRMAAAIRVAASLGLATSVTAAPRGGSVRNVYAGVSARNGLLACDLAEAGVTGEPGGIEAVFGAVIGERFDAEAMAAGLGERWLIRETFLKLSACCRETQGALEGLETLLSEAPFDADSVESVEVDTFAPAAALSERAPEQPIGGRFSIPFTLATRLRRGAAFVGDFAPEALADPAARALAARVTVREDPALTARLPGERICRVAVRLRDGQRRATEIRGTAGDCPDRPLPEAALRNKFDRMAGRMPDARRAALWQAWRHPDAQAEARAMLAL